MNDPHILCAHPPSQNHACDVRRRSKRVVTKKATAPQADAIKAAVDKANNRAADAFHAWKRAVHPFSHMKFHDLTGRAFAEWLRSGEDAPGAVGK